MSFSFCILFKKSADAISFFKETEEHFENHAKHVKMHNFSVQISYFFKSL